MSGKVRVGTALPADREAIVGLIRALNIHEAAITGDRLVTHAAAETYYLALVDRIARQEGRLLAAEAEAAIVGMLGLIIREDQAFVREICADTAMFRISLSMKPGEDEAWGACCSAKPSASPGKKASSGLSST